MAYMWAPIMAEPPMARLSDFKDGTYYLEDLIDMNNAIAWKAEQERKKQKAV